MARICASPDVGQQQPCEVFALRMTEQHGMVGAGPQSREQPQSPPRPSLRDPHRAPKTISEALLDLDGPGGATAPAVGPVTEGFVAALVLAAALPAGAQTALQLAQPAVARREAQPDLRGQLSDGQSPIGLQLGKNLPINGVHSAKSSTPGPPRRQSWDHLLDVPQ